MIRLREKTARDARDARARAYRSQRAVGCAAIAAFLCLSSLRTVTRCHEWRDELTLFEAGVRDRPSSIKA